ncbi:hypothetical protein ACFOY2_12990 [Nonomuraea purpurea]|uniref:Uncharacterized protein n=1 Tax=Nonomuraea purpurea TaxID=1849276 RepID=A0ABV8G735_9ACTN
MRDDDGRALAAAIQQQSPGWMIMWSPWRRQLSAFACWLPNRSLVIDARSPEDLLDLMSSAERSAQTQYTHYP